MTLVAPGRPIKVPEVSRPAEADAKSAEAKLADLRRMRAIALSLLLLMTVIFVATSLAQVHWPALAYLRAFAEAGMVGACADWFAVVALFRRPFGLPIPHTGIVPNNKDRIGVALGRFITNNFLPSEGRRRAARQGRHGWLARAVDQGSRQFAAIGAICRRFAPARVEVGFPARARRIPRPRCTAWRRIDSRRPARLENRSGPVGRRRGSARNRAWARFRRTVAQAPQVGDYRNRV